MKEKFYPKSIFIGANGVSVGSTSINEDGIIFFKPLGDVFGKMTPVLRDINSNKFLYCKLADYNPKNADFTGDEWTLFFMDLVNGDKFSFENTSPSAIQLKMQYLIAENNQLRNQQQELLKSIQASSLKDYEKKRVMDIVEYSRKISNSYSGGNLNTQTD